MAETKEKRTDDSASEKKANNDVKTQTDNSAQNNIKAETNKNTSTGGSIDTNEIFEQAKETAGQAYDKVKEQASSKIVTQKDNLARGLSSVADGIRHFGESLRDDEQQTPIADLTAKYGDSLARQFEQFSDYLEKKDFRELVNDIEVFARHNPAVFIGGAFALGIIAARFLKSSNPNQTSAHRSHRQRKGFYIPDASEGVYLPEDLSRKVGLTDTGKDSGATVNKANQKNTDSGDTKTGDNTDKTSANAFSTNKGG